MPVPISLLPLVTLASEVHLIVIGSLIQHHCEAWNCSWCHLSYWRWRRGGRREGGKAQEVRKGASGVRQGFKISARIHESGIGEGR